MMEGILPGGCMPLPRLVPPGRAEDVLREYDEVILSLPGAVLVAPQDGKLLIGTRDQASSVFLDNLLEDEVRGVSVAFQVFGEFTPHAADGGTFSESQEVLETYAPALRGLPGVQGVTLENRSQPALTVAVAPDQVGFYDDLIANAIEGVQVAIRPA
ncbi:MAG: hypothetical protein AB1758_24445 [Candidatus Eremiobacterota bacterium]